MKAEIMKLQKLVQNNSDSSGERQRCFSCNQEGHYSNKCPNKNNKNKEFITYSNPTSIQKKINKGWRRKGPDNGGKHYIKREDKAYTWCNKCKFWTCGEKMHTTDQHRSKRSTNESESNSTHSSRDNRQNGSANVAQMDNSSSGLRLMTPLYKITGPRALKVHQIHLQKNQNGTTNGLEDLPKYEIKTEYMDFPRMYPKNKYFETKNEQKAEKPISASFHPMSPNEVYNERQLKDDSKDTMLVKNGGREVSAIVTNALGKNRKLDFPKKK